MCLIAFAIGASQRWPLVIASNRDEFLNRPTRPLEQWQTACGQDIISGRDLREGGTWLGMTPCGRVAFLTNVRDGEAKTAALSRGRLVTSWLESRSDASVFASLLEKDKGHYGSFNLVVGDMQRNAWTWITNRAVAPGSPWYSQSLPAGIYGLSNAALDTPWPKTLALKTALTAALSTDLITGLLDCTAPSPLWTALGNRERAPFCALPQTGVSEAMEIGLSSAFVDIPEHGYGTRSSTVLLASRAAGPRSGQALRIDVTEKTYQRAAADSAPLVTSRSFDLF